MSRLKLCGILTVVFFLLLAGVTAYSVSAEYFSAPVVKLAAAEHVGENTYVVPERAVFTDIDGIGGLYFARERQGPWGVEYVCERCLLRVISVEGGSAVIYTADMKTLPVVVSAETLYAGMRVRFS